MNGTLPLEVIPHGRLPPSQRGRAVLAAVTAMPETGKDSWPRMRDGLRADHHAILTAVKAGKGEQAADRLEAHIRGFYSDLTTRD